MHRFSVKVRCRLWDILTEVRRCSSSADSSTSIVVKETTAVPEKTKKRVIFAPDRFRQPESVENESTPFPYVHPDPEEDYYRRRFYPKNKELTEAEKEKGVGGWRRRGGEGNYGRSFRESKRTRDAFVARYGVEALKPAMKRRPFLETQDAGDLDDEDYFDEKEYIYEPIKPRLSKDIPKTMNSLVRSLSKFSREGNHFLAAEIVDEGANCMLFDHTLWTPMHYACDRGHASIVKLYLMKDPDINLQDYDGLTPLMVAARNGHFDVCKRLIQARAELERKDKSNRTALLLALAGRHHRVATLIIDSGANTAIADNDGWNALHYACFYSCKQIISLLLSAEIDIHLQAFEGNTALHWSAACGNHEICSMLITHGADRRVKNHNGWTPAHTAVHWAQTRSLMEIIRSRDDIEIQNKSGETLIDMATRLQHKRLLQTLNFFQASSDTSDNASESETTVLPTEAANLDAVTIHVSGQTFVTSKSTLEHTRGSYFWLMLHPEANLSEDDPTSRKEFGTGPGKELKKVTEIEYDLDRDPNLFAQILDLLRGLRYANLRYYHHPNAVNLSLVALSSEVPLPEDKYEFGMLLDEAKFYRLTPIVDALKAHRRTRQAKSFKNARRSRRKDDRIRLPLPSITTESGIPYVPPSMQLAEGNDLYRQWSPLQDPFAKNIPDTPKIVPRRKPR